MKAFLRLTEGFFLITPKISISEFIVYLVFNFKTDEKNQTEALRNNIRGGYSGR